jgi:outer membrane receptor for ferrienterochelin and colicin
MVSDHQSGSPIPYATITAISTLDSTLINGTTSDDDGEFMLKCYSRDVFIEVSFIGYEKTLISEFTFNDGRASLGKIKLKADTEMLKDAEVTAEHSTLEFKLDKRVFNVGKDISSTGMSAMEVLDNVPSVNVDIEGNITLRGNSGVQILINGKPSVLSDEGSNALGSITADMIEAIEVITNPSAKYEAAGTAGILNIVLKKEEKKGMNGSVSLNTGIPDNHSIGLSLNLRTENFNFFTQVGAGYRSLPSFNESLNENSNDSTTLRSEGLGFRNEEFYNITLGADYYLNDLNTITLSGRFAYEVEQQPSETEFYLFEDDVLVSQWLRTEATSATNPKYQYDLQYEKKFEDNEDHNLLFSHQASFFGKDQSSEFFNSTLEGDDAYNTQFSESDWGRADFTFKLDYTDPLTEQITLETGGMYEINNVGNDYKVYEEIDENMVLDSGLTNNFEYNQTVLGVYGTTSYENEKWGVKVGVRLENTDLKTLLTTTDEKSDQNYTNLFPSIHTSYKFSKLFSLQAGYSRRIYRPRLWDLNPFFNIRNNFNIRTGNPELQP